MQPGIETKGKEKDTGETTKKEPQKQRMLGNVRMLKAQIH